MGLGWPDGHTVHPARNADELSRFRLLDELGVGHPELRRLG
ncbi:conserved domain protein [Eggerthella sp. HGA1]|nr:conserved domain protein [Eggerthella sp. HGA1]